MSKNIQSMNVKCQLVLFYDFNAQWSLIALLREWGIAFLFNWPLGNKLLFVFKSRSILWIALSHGLLHSQLLNSLSTLLIFSDSGSIPLVTAEERNHRSPGRDDRGVGVRWIANSPRQDPSFSIVASPLTSFTRLCSLFCEKLSPYLLQWIGLRT